MTAYYNEFEPYAAEWLRNLIAEGLIAPGDVDERSIEEVAPDELEGYTQCHFFAGIGGWGHALRLAGWPDELPVWTGSVPCQPLSSAGQRRGHADRRHLWPAFFRLIAECRPAVVFGEQVASNLGREWLAGVRADLEHVGYACGAADLPAACVGAPHIRQRLWWVAHSECGSAKRHRHEMARAPREGERETRQQRIRIDAGDGGSNGGLADNLGERYAPLQQRGTGDVRRNRKPQRRGGACGLGDADDDRLEGPQALWTGQPGATWASENIPCADGKARRIEPGTFPLAHGVPNRVGRLRAYGNAIVPQVAAAFIRAYRDVREVA